MLERMVSNGRTGSWLALIGAALLTVGGVAVYHRPFETIRLALRLWLRIFGISRKTVEVDGLPVRYLEAGSASRGPTLVLVHGLGGSAQDWAFVIPALARGHRVLALDLPDFRDTPQPPERMSILMLERYLDGFLNRLGLERTTLAGNSLGGVVVIRQAARRPERVERIFLLDSAGLLYEPPPALEPRDREQARESIGMVSGRPSHSPGFLLDSIVRRTEDLVRWSNIRSDEPIDVKDELPRVTVPTTIIWSDWDRLIPPENGERMHEEIPDSELIILENVGHVPQMQVPREVVRILRERLR